MSPEVEFKIGRHIEGEIEHTYQVFDVEGGELFEANLTEARFLYHFNRRSFVRAIVQYRAIDRNGELYTFDVAERVRDFFAQFLFSYKLNPQTALLVGYADDRLGVGEIDLTQTSRSFFVKVGYAFLF